jgi:hypothetical protein
MVRVPALPQREDLRKGRDRLYFSNHLRSQRGLVAVDFDRSLADCGVEAPITTEIRIDGVADKCALHDLSLEVRPEAGRARNPPGRPLSSWNVPAATLPGLTYGATAHAVAYNEPVQTQVPTAVDNAGPSLD